MEAYTTFTLSLLTHSLTHPSTHPFEDCPRVPGLFLYIYALQIYIHVFETRKDTMDEFFNFKTFLYFVLEKKQGDE